MNKHDQNDEERISMNYEREHRNLRKRHHIKNFENNHRNLHKRLKKNNYIQDFNKSIDNQPAVRIDENNLQNEFFEVVSNQQVAKANDISKKGIRKAIDDLYKNYENDEDLSTDFKSFSSWNYISGLNQERKKNQLENK